MKFRDWALCIGLGSFIIVAELMVLYGYQQVIIDTGRAIVHK